MKLFFKTTRIILVALFVSGCALLFLVPRPPLLENLSFSTAVFDEKHQLLRLTLNKEEKYRLYTPLAAIDPKLINATLLQEDQYFYWHYGVNPFAMIKAACQTYLRHSRRVGASTITMQLARMRYGINSKKLSGKIWQIIRAIQLEVHYSKDQILEAYLNMAPYGGNIEGAGAASLIYFNKEIKKATLAEALTLSIIPQNPAHRTPRNTKLNDIRDKLFLRWVNRYPEDASKKASLDLPLEMQTVRNLPFIAPHFVNGLLKDISPLPQVINTTLDARLQKILERVTHNYIKRKNNLGAYNAAILLVDTRDMSIKGMVGSADFFNNSIGGQINGTLTKRSPGSTLKPFIYGLALDQGLIHPATVLKDVPRSFGSYNPENFDYDFMGPIKAKDALVLSRNIPAIYLASQLNKHNLYQLLSEAEVSNLKSESFYGLALTLGGAELSMSELASLYAMLVNDGVWRSLRKRADEPLSLGKRLLSPEASFLVLDMLKNTPNPESAYTSTSNKSTVSWKTGTSSGFRDAWSVGSFGPYVLTVWIGNFDNKSNPAFVGKNIAAPLFFELIDAIKHERGSLPVIDKYPESMNLVQVEVCKASGMLPTRYCRDKEMTWFIPGKSPIQTDTIYREVAIDNKTGLRTCHFNENTHFEIYEFWPSDLLKIFKQAGIQRRTPPFYEPDCTLNNNTGLRPQITSPQSEISYIVRANTTQKNQIPLSAVTDADVKNLYWFINDAFLARTQPGQSFFWNARPGKFIVRAVDDHGLSDARDIIVQLDS
ncbi:MAG: penicillin-binding protein 1C [Legionella sp.]|nr:penicillin-binding protein 1C [Legionella sp.]